MLGVSLPKFILSLWLLNLEFIISATFQPAWEKTKFEGDASKW